MTLYVSDLDGTLLNNNARLSEISKTLLNNAIDNNINFTIATARTPATIVSLLSGLNLNLPIITMNGSAIYDIKNDKYIYYNTIKNVLVSDISKILKDINANAFIYTIKDNHLYVYHNKLIHPYQIEFYELRKNTKFKTFIEGCPSIDSEVLYFTIMDYEDKVNELYNRIKDLDNLYIVKYRDTYNKDIINLEIYDINSSKANAINYFKNELNFSRLITFGDNINDIPMFQISDECYAVDNAVSELKEISTDIIGLNTSDSVAKLISSLNK